MPTQDLQRGPNQPPTAEDANRVVVQVNSTGEKLQWTNNSGTVTEAVDNTNAQTVAGVKTFSSNPKLSGVADTNAQDRFLPNSAAKTIVDGSATSLFDVACLASAMSGGVVHFLVRASDGTDFQAIAGIASYSIVNKAATLTGTVTYVTGNEAKAVSSGTLTLAFTIVTGTNKMTVKVQPTGSLTETTPYTIEYTVFPIRGAVTIL